MSTMVVNNKTIDWTKNFVLDFAQSNTFSYALYMYTNVIREDIYFVIYNLTLSRKNIFTADLYNNTIDQKIKKHKNSS